MAGIISQAGLMGWDSLPMRDNSTMEPISSASAENSVISKGRRQGDSGACSDECFGDCCEGCSGLGMGSPEEPVRTVWSYLSVLLVFLPGCNGYNAATYKYECSDERCMVRMIKVLAAVLVGFGLTAGVVTASVEDQIRARIAPVGEVCLQGDDCGSAAPAAASSDGPRSGSDVYASACQACHAAGVAGAPVTGDASAWEGRVDQGLETLVSHAINGLGAMPPKGGCGSCSDDDIEAAVTYMVDEL